MQKDLEVKGMQIPNQTGAARETPHPTGSCADNHERKGSGVTQTQFTVFVLKSRPVRSLRSQAGPKHLHGVPLHHSD